jgi:hypothetical protein
MPKKTRPGQRPTGRVQTHAAVRRGDPADPPPPRTGCGAASVLLTIGMLCLPGAIAVVLIIIFPAVVL